jgi:hypothetical protein
VKTVIAIVALLSACASESSEDPHAERACASSWAEAGFGSPATCEAACVDYVPLAPLSAPLVCRVRWKDDAGLEQRGDCREGETFEYGGQLGCCEPGPWGDMGAPAVRFVSCSEEQI